MSMLTYWQVKYFANLLKIIVGVTLTWQEAIAFSKYRIKMALFKFGGVKTFCQTAKLKSPPNKLHTVHFCSNKIRVGSNKDNAR